MTDKYANLHLHSNRSDGGFRPAHLCCLAKSLGYGAIALTDHENIFGVDELLACAENNGLEAITGVEVDGLFNGKYIYHVVGLDFDHHHPSIVALTDMMTRDRNEHTQILFECARERGLFPKSVTWDDIVRANPGCKWFCNDQVYLALDALGIIPLDRRHETYKEAFKTGEAPRKYQRRRPEITEVINAIREAGGIPVLAHPYEHSFANMRELVDLGIKGIEISHPEVDERRTKMAVHAALEYNLYCSGGTDHHGPMSACGGELAYGAYHGASYDEFRAIKERRLG